MCKISHSGAKLHGAKLHCETSINIDQVSGQPPVSL